MQIKVIIGLISISFILLFPLHSAGKSITIIDNINRLKITLPCIIENSHRMVSLSEIAKIFKIYMEWNPITKRVVLTRDNNKLIFTIGSKNVRINNRFYNMSTPLKLVTGRIFIPIDFIVKHFQSPFSILIRWDEQNQILTIDTKETYVSSLEAEILRRFPPLSNLSNDYNNYINREIVEKMENIEIKTENGYKDNELVSTIPPDNFKIKTIVIDPGHGGIDPGAVGKTGLLEKDVVLDIAKKLRFALNRALPDVSILLTRDNDYFVPLRERTKFANYKKADMFISIHSNAAFSRNARGFEVFYLSTEASDDVARAIAAAENEVISLERDNDTENIDMVKLILGDIAQQEFIEESIELAGLVQTIVCDELNITNRGLKSAFFWVLKDAMMPAILIEIGFLSNPFEENMLRSHRFRNDVVSAICDAIVAYKNMYDGNMGFAIHDRKSR